MSQPQVHYSPQPEAPPLEVEKAPPGNYQMPPGQYAPPQFGMQNAPPYQGGYVPQQNMPHQQGQLVQQWMTMPPGVQGCPRGLEYLTQVDQILVHQRMELLEAFTGFETANKYEIKNSLGQKVYFAAEQSDCCTRQFCGPCRNFDMQILDNTQTEVIHIERPMRCASCWTPCCLQEMTITAPPGTPIGSIKQTWHMILPRFDVLNEHGNCILKIEGPCLACNCCGDVDFKVMTNDGSEIGKISKQWSGLVKEAFMDADNFGVQFPMDLDVKAKACLLGAVFLIDFMFFEKSGNNDNQKMGVWQMGN